MKKTRCQLNNAVPKSLVILTLLYFCQYDIDLFGLAGTDIGQRDGIPSLVLVLDCVQFFGGRDGLILDAVITSPGCRPAWSAAPPLVTLKI